MGILPWLSLTPILICPDIYSTTGWCKRQLTSEEQLAILDVPIHIQSKLSAQDVQDAWGDTSFIPLNCLSTLLDAVLLAFSCHTPLAPICHQPQRAEPSYHKQSVGALAVLPASPNLPLGPPTDLTHMEPDRFQSATKADDAIVPIHFWNSQVLLSPASARDHLLTCLRKVALQWWVRRTTRCFLQWFRKEHASSLSFGVILADPSQKRDWEAGRDCIRRCTQASWWDWDGGLHPFFWRWPSEYKRQIRDSIDLWVIDQLPRYHLPQCPEKDPAVHAAVTTKLEKVQRRGYIAPGWVSSLTSYFAVPKGPTDIRMVYDGTKCGLNDQLWAPWLALPMIEDHLWGVEPGTYMCDLDIMEQFLNFMLSPAIRPYAGVNLTPHFCQELPSNRKVL